MFNQNFTDKYFYNAAFCMIVPPQQIKWLVFTSQKCCIMVSLYRVITIIKLYTLSRIWSAQSDSNHPLFALRVYI